MKVLSKQMLVGHQDLSTGCYMGEGGSRGEAQGGG